MKTSGKNILIFSILFCFHLSSSFSQTFYDSPHISYSARNKSYWGMGFGPYYSKNMHSNAMMYSFAATNHRAVNELTEMQLRLNGSFAEDGSVHASVISMGAAYLPLTGDITPVFGANFGFGYASGKQIKLSGGFSGSAQVGVRFFRTAQNQMELSGRYESVFKGNDLGFPAIYGIQLAVLL